MTTAADIATDLLTPLGAYLGLRGRFSFVGCGARLCTLEEAEAAGEPVVGYLGYDHVARLEPTVPLPDEGSELPESRFVVADVLLRFDHVGGVAEVLRGDPSAVGELLAAPPGRFAVTPTRPGRTRRFP